MPKFVLLSSAILLIPSYAFAQDIPNHPSASQCQQIRQAVAQYGYGSARQYALQNYGPEAVKFGEQCFTSHASRFGRRSAVNASETFDER
jgi:hypothetical protein